MSALRLAVVFGAVFGLLLVASAAVLRLLLAWRAARGRRGSPAIEAALVLAPPIAALVGCLALAFPDPFAACHCAAHGLHHPHLCLDHPALVGPLFLPAAALLALWTALLLPRLAGLGRALLASFRWARAARGLPAAQLDGVTVQFLEGGAPGAFTIGVAAPLIAVDRRLWDALSPEARRAVVHHEHAHVERRDGLTLIALKLAALLSPFPLGPRVLDGWKAAVESACDQHAARVLGDPGAVAAALVAVETLRAAQPERPTDLVLAQGIGAGGELERRVLTLLGPEDRSAARAELLGNDLLAVVLVAAAAGTLTLVWPGGAFHHAVETAIGLLTP